MINIIVREIRHLPSTIHVIPVFPAPSFVPIYAPTGIASLSLKVFVGTSDSTPSVPSEVAGVGTGLFDSLVSVKRIEITKFPGEF